MHEFPFLAEGPVYEVGGEAGKAGIIEAAWRDFQVLN